MKELYARLSSIVTIRIIEKRESTSYVYFDKEFNVYTYENWLQRLFHRPKVTTERHSGWYCGYSYKHLSNDWKYVKNNVKTESEILTDDIYLIEDYKLYIKPHIYIKFSNKDSYEKYFNTIEDAKEYVEKLTVGNLDFKKLINE